MDSPRWCPVHPRARGEHLTDTDRLVADMRFIPAHAGNTLGGQGVGGADGGSSPRTRGTRQPARQRQPRPTVHPRARGEHPTLHCWRLARAGSSPRTRGTHDRALDALDPARFIPAHAGNTALAPPPVSLPTVHPRARGEHVIAGLVESIGFGSSPRTRGTRGACRAVHLSDNGSSPRTRGTPVPRIP